MNFYVQLIGELLDWIETRMDSPLTLAELAAHARMSGYHLNRVFSTVTGMTAKQYVLGRKLTRAMELLGGTPDSVIDVALQLGFEYPEVFSRSFRGRFGLSPSRFRATRPTLPGVPKASVTERDIVSRRGTLTLRARCVQREALPLRGVRVETDVRAEGFQESLKAGTEAFLLRSAGDGRLEQDAFYTTVTCSGEDDGRYTVFCGRRPITAGRTAWRAFTVPAGWYAAFDYAGDMFRIRTALQDDLFRWLMVRQARLVRNGIGMLTAYPGDYPRNPAVKMLVPLERPV